MGTSDPRGRRVFKLPETPAGLWSFRFLISFAVMLGMMFALTLSGQRGGNTFFANPWPAVTALAALATAGASWLCAFAAILIKRERPLLVFGALLPGSLLAVFLIGEFVHPH